MALIAVRRHIFIKGVVQGVGFRPFIYQLAKEHGLVGWVLNNSAGVVVEVEGPAAEVEAFVAEIPVKAPPLAQIEVVESDEVAPEGEESFVIRKSEERPGDFILVSPDIATCDDCARELFDSADRRYRYPFINCTNCGPRFTIIEDIPYDRPKTTMKKFPMCPECQREYEDPLNRRFHAQPNACPVCGPSLELRVRASNDADGATPSDFAVVSEGDLITKTIELLEAGKILAIKGLGGFHLACDARNEAAVAELRRRKHRYGKPLALMFADLEAVREVCEVSGDEERLLTTPQRPIVLLDLKKSTLEGKSPLTPLCERGETDPSMSSSNNVECASDGVVASGRGCLATTDTCNGGVLSENETLPEIGESSSEALRDGDEIASGLRPLAMTDSASGTMDEVLALADGNVTRDIAPSVAPGVNTLGVMLPYTPLHHILLKESGLALVMTSGNLSEEPIAMENDEAMERLCAIADAFLLNNRDIYSRYDDSVTRIVRGERAFMRRARGFAPHPISLPFTAREVLAVGPEQKNTFCLTKEKYAFISQHIGDLENAETLEHFERTLSLYKRLFRIEPQLVVHDLHPEYLSTKFAKELPLPLVGVQHHHAHAAACLAENGITSPAIAVSFDGTGYGADGAIWGGEFFLCDLAGFDRRAHLSYTSMPGGAQAIKKPYRMALGYLYEAFGREAAELPLEMVRSVPEVELKTVFQQIEKGFNSPRTSSAGRLFDAVAALAGVRGVALYDGQAAIELEMAAEAGSQAYPFEVLEEGSGFVVDTSSLIKAVVADVLAGAGAPVIAGKFHRAVARMIVEVCGLIRAADGNNTVALSGGVFQNALLFGEVVDRLRAAKFDVVYHRLLPTNDGGVAFGQAVIANRMEG